MQLHIPLKEYERIRAAADSRGLGDQSFMLMVVSGAISQGGGTLDRLVEVGSRTIPARRRSGERYADRWQRTVHGTYTWGRWELFKLNPRRAKGGEDPVNWWHLKHQNFPAASRPIAFTQKEAVIEASKLIDEGYLPSQSLPHPGATSPSTNT